MGDDSGCLHYNGYRKPFELSKSDTKLKKFLALFLMKCSPDFTQFAKSKSAAIPALIATQLGLLLAVILFGILSTSAAVQFFPQEPLLWGPYDLLMAFQVHGGKGARAGAFFGGICLILAQIGINVAS